MKAMCILAGALAAYVAANRMKLNVILSFTPLAYSFKDTQGVNAATVIMAFSEERSFIRKLKHLLQNHPKLENLAYGLINRLWKEPMALLIARWSEESAA